MKTKESKFTKSVKYLFLGLLVFSIQSCETDIPITDTDDPIFSFQIKGDGFNQTFNNETDFSQIQLNLRSDEYYEYTLTGVDSGGVDIIQWQSETAGNIIFEFGIDSPWTIRDISPLSKLIEWRGDRNNPLTGSSIRGTLRTNGTAFLAFRFYIRDFGGERRISNSSNGALIISVGNHTTEVIRR